MVSYWHLSRFGLSSPMALSMGVPYCWLAYGCLCAAIKLPLLRAQAAAFVKSSGYGGYARAAPQRNAELHFDISMMRWQTLNSPLESRCKRPRSPKSSSVWKPGAGWKWGLEGRNTADEQQPAHDQGDTFCIRYPFFVFVFCARIIATYRAWPEAILQPYPPPPPTQPLATSLSWICQAGPNVFGRLLSQ